MDLKNLEELLPEGVTLLALSGEEAIHKNPSVGIDMALGISFGVENKLLCLLDIPSLFKSLNSLVQIGYLGRSNLYMIVIYNKKDRKLKYINHKSLLYGLGFNVFDYTKAHSSSGIEQSIGETLNRIKGPVCIFIEQ